jgi:carboxyl-terminal processing protease
MRGRAFYVAVLLVAVIAAGSWLVRRGLATPTQRGRLTSAQGQRLLSDVMQRVQASWVDSTNTDELYRRAAIGVVQELGDPNSAYLTADRLRRLREVTTGNYRGVGLSVDQREGWIVVTATRAGSPADRSGIQVGDRLVELDGQSMKGWSFDEARNALRGPIGSALALSIERNGAKIPLKLERSDIHVSSVTRMSMLPGNVAYFAVLSFSDSTALEVANTLDSLVKAGATSLVLDLRGNPGGLLVQGVAVADLFLDPGQKIVTTKGRMSGANASFTDTAPQRWPKLPIVVLVNAGTASSAEIVAGALQDHDRAVVLGRQSYGKGSAQALITLGDGAALKLTNALWYTPAGRSIDRPHRLVRRGAADDTVVIDTVRPKYRTDKGRTVLGGGGIAPDLIVGDSTLAPAEKAWVRAVGTKVPQFRDALSAYATDVTRRKLVKDPDFTVTPAMRDGLYKMMESKNVVVSRKVYDAAHEAVARVLGSEIARQAFGIPGAQHRAVKSDEVIAKAAALLRGAVTPKELFTRVETTAGSPH